MAEQQNILIKILADVAGANASFGKLQKTLANLSGGTITLAKNMNAFQQGVRGSIGAQKAAEQVSKAHLQIMRQRLNLSRAEAAGMQAITAMHNAEAAAIRAKVALINAELAADNAVLREMQQELQLRKLSVSEIETENRERRALIATKKLDSAATQSTTSQTKGATEAVTDMSHANGSASFALLSLTQGLQDAGQFGMGMAQGIRAVNNNLQQFVTATILAQKQAGNMSAAFGLMIRQLAGPAGFLFVFSLASAAVEFFANRSQRAGNKTDEFRKKLQALTSVSELPGIELGVIGLRNMASAYDQMTKLAQASFRQREKEYVQTVDFIRAKEKETEQDIINATNASKTLQTYRALTRTLVTYKEQVEDTATENNELAKSLREEADQAERLEIAYLAALKVVGAEGLAESIVAQTARRKEIEGIVEMATLLAESGIPTINQFNSALNQTNETLNALSPMAVLTAEKFAELFASGEIDDYIQKMRDRYAIETDLQKITKELSHLRDQINSKDFEAIAIKELELDLAQQFADAQRQNIQLTALKASIEAGDETQLAITTAQITAIKGVNEGLREQVKLLLIKRGMTPEEIESIFSSLGIAEDDVEKADEMTRAMERLNAAMARTAAQGIAKVATGLLDVAIGGESFKDAILGPIADMAIQLGKIAIATGLTMEKLKFSFANPGAAIAAGVALVVAGKLVKSTISKASKGSASSAGVSASRFSSPNAFSGAGNISNPMFSGAGILTPNNMVTVEVQGRLRGSDIYLSGRSETRSRSRMGVAG